MIVAPNSPRQGVIAGFVIEPAAQVRAVTFTANSTWIGVGGSTGWSPAVGQEIEFIPDAYSGLPLVTGSVFNWRGPWQAGVSYATNDLVVWFDSSGNLQTWLATASWAGGSSFNPATWRILTFRGPWQALTAYLAGDVVTENDTSGNLQAWVANSSFTSGPTFSAGTQWVGALAAKQIFYIVSIGGSSIQISTAPGGAAITFMSAGFFIAPDTASTINAYFGAGSFGGGAGLVPSLSLGVLFAQGTIWQPATVPTVSAAPTNQFSYLAYNSTTGLYWTTNPAGTTAGDAVLGWVVTNGTDILGASNQDVPVAPATGNSTFSSVYGGGSGYTGGGLAIPTSSGLIPSGIEAMTAVSGNLTPDLSKGWTHQATLTGNVTLKQPINIGAGETFIVQLTEDATGGRTLTFDTYYKGVSEFDLDTRANRYATLLFQIQLDGLSALLLLVAGNGVLKT